MAGSPTILTDGTDPFARPGQQPSLSCRLYRDEQGNPGPALAWWQGLGKEGPIAALP